MSLLKKMVCFVLSILMVLSLTACGGTGENKESAEKADEAEKVTLTFFSNLPDRTQGEGLLEQKQIDAFLAIHPEVEIKLETLSDDPYQTKLQTYMSSGNMPDVFNMWAAPYFLSPLVAGGFAEPFDPAEFADHGYLPGALEAFTVDGKVFGAPKTIDFWTVYYNEALFEEAGIPVPTTLDEYYEAAKVFKDMGISLCAIGGKETYTLSCVMTCLYFRTTGVPTQYRDALYAGKMSEDEAVLRGTKYFTEMIEGGIFQPSFLQDDYGTAQNLFFQGQAAMYMGGSWDMGIAVDPNLDEEFRSHIRAAKFPVIEGEVGTIDQLESWFGSGYAVSSNSPNKELAKEFVKFIMSPEVFAKTAWEEGIKMPPMDFSEYMVGNETVLQKDLIQIMNEATSGGFDCMVYDVSATFGADAVTYTSELASGIITPEDFLQKIDAAAVKNQ